MKTLTSFVYLGEGGGGAGVQKPDWTNLGSHLPSHLYGSNLECPSGRDSVCKLWGDIRTVAPQCLANEMMGMTPNTLVAFWFSGFICNYAHEWDKVYRIVPNRRALREWRPLGARLLISSESFILFCQLR